MKVNPGFSLCMIENIPYILPYGQNIADHKNGVKLNESGQLLWELIQKCDTEEKVFELFCRQYEAESREDIKVLRRDFDDFVNMLKFYGIMESDAIIINKSETLYLKIAGLNIKLQTPSGLLEKHFEAFKAEPFDNSDLEICIIDSELKYSKNGQLIIRNKELFVIDTEDNYCLLFPQAEGIYEAQINKSGEKAKVYIQEPYDETLKNDIFHAIRLLFLYRAQLSGMYVIHSASILYNEKLWLFAGHSGNGKSTHTNLWKEHIGTPIINGDLNLICMGENGPVSKGIPWCGTSDIFDTNSYELGGIVFVRRGESDVCEELSTEEKTILLTQHMISPNWTKEMLLRNLTFAKTVTEYVKVYKLTCTKTYSAVEAIKRRIDA